MLCHIVLCGLLHEFWSKSCRILVFSYCKLLYQVSSKLKTNRDNNGVEIHNSHIMKELVSLDIFYNESDCTNATQHCNNWEPGSYCKIKELNWKTKSGVLGHSSCFQICYSREDKVQWSEPNCPTDGHKISKKRHGRRNKSNKNHVNWSKNKTDELISQGKMAISFIGQHSFLKAGKCWPAVYLKRRGIQFINIWNQE